MSIDRQARADARRAMKEAGVPEDKIVAALELMVRPRVRFHVTRLLKKAIEDRLARDGIVCLRMFRSGKGVEFVSKEFVKLSPRYHFEKPEAHRPEPSVKKKRTLSPEGLANLRAGAQKTSEIMKARRARAASREKVEV